MSRGRKPKPETSLLDQLSTPLRAFVNDFAQHGEDVLKTVRERSPERYLELATKLAGLVATLKPAADPNDLRLAQTSRELGCSLLISVGLPAPTDEQIDAAVIANDRFVQTLEQIRDDAGYAPPDGTDRGLIVDERRKMVAAIDGY